MTDDDGQGFIAPRYQRPTPLSIQAAGVRLYAYAVAHNVPNDVAILDMRIPDEPEFDTLAQDQRLMQFFAEQQPR